MSFARSTIDRRSFLAAAGAAAIFPRRGPAAEPLAAEPAAGRIALGFDNFSVRAFGWKGPKLLEHASSLGVDTLLISDLDSLGGLEDAYLKDLAKSARDRGIELQVGTGSICPSSRSYNRSKLGPAEDHIRLLLRVAKAVGSRVARCYQGTGADREGDGGIYRHIDETVKTLKAVRSEAVDSGAKIAIENHAGDMQAWELVSLIEAAGKDFVGATLDSGNAMWTLEDPMVNLEILGPYAVTTGMRDTSVWETDRGASMMWSNLGDGVVDWPAYVKRFRELCPGVPFILEILSYTWERQAPYLEPDFWNVFPKARASEFARFVRLVKRGERYEIPAERPKGERSPALEQAQQAWDLEASVRYAKRVLGLGRK